MKTGGILLAGGIGKRFRSDIPKQFLELEGKKIIEYSIDKFQAVVDDLVIVCHSDWIDYLKNEIIQNKLIKITTGGETRQLSVYQGLLALKGNNIDVVAVHDGARPLFTPRLLRECLDSAQNNLSGIAGIFARDTIAFVENGKFTGYADRSKTVQVQTPQAFDFKKLLTAHQTAIDNGFTSATDDSGLFMESGFPVCLVEGESTNIKITRPEDLIISREILKYSRP